jgi:hypothetical protein
MTTNSHTGCASQRREIFHLPNITQKSYVSRTLQFTEDTMKELRYVDRYDNGNWVLVDWTDPNFTFGIPKDLFEAMRRIGL